MRCVLPAGTVVPPGSVSPDGLIVPERERVAMPTTVVMRLRFDYSAHKGDDLYRSGELSEELRRLRATLWDLGSPRVERAVRSMSAESLWEIEAEARSMSAEFESPVEIARSLTQYWRVYLEGGPDRARELLERLSALRESVELAYQEGEITDAGLVTYTDDPLAQGGTTSPATWQRYQDASPVGVDARYAWDFTSGDGVGLVDLEQQWFKEHEDLDAVDPITAAVTPFETAVPLLYGVNAVDTGLSGYSGSHGASVWGVLVGRDNTVGGVGLAPKLVRAGRASHMVPLGGGGFEINHFAEALLEAVRNHMQPGDVLLIESQMTVNTPLDGGPAVVEIVSPIEVQALERDAIQLAVSMGMIVIEPAGNGGEDLDDLSKFWGGRFVEGDAQFEDSGAIMVSASVPPDHNARLNGANFGKRVNCFAWGEQVWTAGRNGVDPDDQAYGGSFNGTSAASAIIAGVAVLVQSYYKATTGGLLSSLQMRALLSDPNLGVDRVALGIGVMPDLRRVLPALGLQPDIYLRDNLADTGLVPTSGFLSSSPDIIALQHAVADPQASFGEGSANRDRVDLSEPVAAGSDHHLYVRMMNRGSADAVGATATLYYSPPATLVTPDLWTEIGTTPPLTVPQGGALTVSDALVWPAAKLPAPGHYCFVALLDHGADPAPPVPEIGGANNPTWEDFLTFIRANNNVAWRNFNVVPATEEFVGRFGQLPFLVVGAPNAELGFELELLHHLPQGSRVWLHLDPGMRRRWKPSFAWLSSAFRFSEWLPLAGLRGVRLGTFKLAAGARYRCRLAITLPRGKASQGARIAVRQVYEGQEVGRVTWQFGAAKF